MRNRRLGLACAMLVLAAAAVSAGLAAPVADPITVLAKGLNNPRGLEVAPDGAVYVAEAGSAGRKCMGKGEDKTCFAFSGSVTEIRNGTQKRVIGGLLSVGGQDGSFSVGADDVAIGVDGAVYTVMADAPIPDAQKKKLAGRRGLKQMGAVLRGKTKSVVANVGAFETKNNPDGREVNPNPYGLVVGPDRIVVVDAGANTVLSIDPRGEVSLVAVIPTRKVGKKNVESVPTSVTIGPDGAYYIGELGGDGLPPHQANVYRLVPGEAPTVYATGFDTITGVAFGPDGSLYVAELLRNGFGQAKRKKPDFTGDLIRVAPDGSRTELGGGKLTAVGGVAVSSDGKVYASTFSVFARRGQVVEVRG